MADGKKTGVDFGLLVLRLALGGILIMHGAWFHMWGPNAKGLQGMTDFLAGLNLPNANVLAVAAISAEIGGSLLVVLGLFARLGALSLAAVMVVAIVKVHWQNGFFLPLEAAAPGRILHGYEYCLALLAMSLCILFAGPGGIRIPIGKGGGG